MSKQSSLKEIVTSEITVDKKLFTKPLPEIMILYAMDIDHLIITEKSNKAFEEKAIVKEKVRVFEYEETYTIKIPQKIYDFYRLDENDYTIMVSEKEPITIVIAI